MKKDWTVTLSVKGNLESLLLSLLGSVKVRCGSCSSQDGQGKADRIAVDHRRMEEQAQVYRFPSGNDESN